MDAQPADRHAVEPVVSKLIALSRNAQINVDLDDPADYWYRLGQRNAYAHAVGLVISRGIDQKAFEVSDRLTKALADGQTQLAALERVATSAPSAAPPPLDWIAPQAFAVRYGDIRGADRDFGTRWGERGDIRISLRCAPDAMSGLLYAHDPLWDEYAVLGREVTSAAVEAAFAQALQVDVHMDVAAFNERVRSHMILGRPAQPPAPVFLRVIEP